MIRHVAEHRFLRSTHLVQLMDRPRDKVLRRLAALYHHGYLDRPHAQIDILARGGSAPIVYALGNKGAALDEASGIDWTDKNRNVQRPYIEHALMVADFMVALECALRAYPAIKLVRSRDIIEDRRRTTGWAHSSWTMTVKLPKDGITISATPDKVFALDFADTGHRNYFVVEADRSTMPIERPSFDQSSFKRKLLAYHYGHQSKQHTALWGIPGFRVLTLAKSGERISSMIDVIRQISQGKGSNVFLFGASSALLLADPVSFQWTTGKHRSVGLITRLELHSDHQTSH